MNKNYNNVHKMDDHVPFLIKSNYSIGRQKRKKMGVGKKIMW